VIGERKVSEEKNDKTYTVTLSGRAIVCYNVWEHDPKGTCYQRFLGHCWDEVEEFITLMGGVVPPRPADAA
jgi:hypothetical protein